MVLYITIIIEKLKWDFTKNCNIAILAEKEIGSRGGRQQKKLPIRKPIVKVYSSWLKPTIYAYHIEKLKM